MKTSIPWARVAVEGVVIVFSVLVALSADAWWDARQDQGRLRISLEALLEDAQENVGRVEAALDAARSQMEAAVALGDLLAANPAEGDRAEVVYLLVRALGISDLTQVTQAYDQAVAAGELGTLPSPIRAGLADWMQSLVRYRDYVEAQGIQRRLLQYESYYIDVVGVREVLTSARPDLPLGEIRFQLDLERLAADRRFDSLLAYRIIFADNQIAELERSLQALTALEAALVESLADI